jgi:hypothetical protein
MTFKKVLDLLYVRQEQTLKSNGYTSSRINPYNPLSYVIIIVLIILGILAYGFVGVFEVLGFSNPFK